MKDRVVAVAAVLAAAFPGLAGQTPPAAPDQRFRTRTTLVEVDAVVRDGRDRPVTDLTAADFEVFEDGVAQKVVAFSPPSAGATFLTTAQDAAAPARPTETATESLSVVALVFDRLGPEGRALAQRAANMYVTDIRRPGDFVGVFGIELSLQIIQPYSTDGDRLRKAVDEAASRATSTHTRLQDQSTNTSAALTALPDEQTGALKTAPPTGVASAESPGQESVAPGQTVASDAATLKMAEMMRRMERSYEMLMRDQRGYATTNGLQAIVQSMGNLPGRKSIIFFSEGLAIPPDVLPRFESVIAFANRANVSVYALDAAGLRARSTMAETRREMAQALGEVRKNDQAGIMMRGLERSEDLLRDDPASGLGILANATGGLLIDKTNDLQAGLRRVATDQRSYYLLSYSPSNPALDGRFRRIEVKVRRSGLKVQARRGYLAADTEVPLLAYEAPAAVLLETTPLPNAFPIRAQAFSVPDDKRPGLSPLLVHLITSSLEYEQDAQAGRFRAEAVVFARVRDAQKRVVRKFSQQYVLGGTLAQLDQSKKGEILFYREAELPAGLYTVEAIVYDAISRRASVRAATLEVPAQDAGALAVGSLMLVRRAERLPDGEADPNHPLHVEKMLLYPRLGEPYQKGSEAQVTFYVPIRPAAAGAAPPRATLDVMSGGQALAQLPLTLAAPDASGRIRQTGSLPLAALPSGSYELRLTVEQGAARAVRSVAFSVTG